MSSIEVSSIVVLCYHYTQCNVIEVSSIVVLYYYSEVSSIVVLYYYYTPTYKYVWGGYKH